MAKQRIAISREGTPVIDSTRERHQPKVKFQSFGKLQQEADKRNAQRAENLAEIQKQSERQSAAAQKAAETQRKAMSPGRALSAATSLLKINQITKQRADDLADATQSVPIAVRNNAIDRLHNDLAREMRANPDLREPTEAELNKRLDQIIADIEKSDRQGLRADLGRNPADPLAPRIIDQARPSPLDRKKLIDEEVQNLQKSRPGTDADLLRNEAAQRVDHRTSREAEKQSTLRLLEQGRHITDVNPYRTDPDTPTELEHRYAALQDRNIAQQAMDSILGEPGLGPVDPADFAELTWLEKRQQIADQEAHTDEAVIAIDDLMRSAADNEASQLEKSMGLVPSKTDALNDDEGDFANAGLDLSEREIAAEFERRAAIQEEAGRPDLAAMIRKGATDIDKQRLKEELARRDARRRLQTQGDRIRTKSEAAYTFLQPQSVTKRALEQGGLPRFDRQTQQNALYNVYRDAARKSGSTNIRDWDESDIESIARGTANLMIDGDGFLQEKYGFDLPQPKAWIRNGAIVDPSEDRSRALNIGLDRKINDPGADEKFTKYKGMFNGKNADEVLAQMVSRGDLTMVEANGIEAETYDAWTKEVGELDPKNFYTWTLKTLGDLSNKRADVRHYFDRVAADNPEYARAVAATTKTILNKVALQNRLDAMRIEGASQTLGQDESAAEQDEGSSNIPLDTSSERVIGGGPERKQIPVDTSDEPIVGDEQMTAFALQQRAAEAAESDDVFLDFLDTVQPTVQTIRSEKQRQYLQEIRDDEEAARAAVGKFSSIQGIRETQAGLASVFNRLVQFVAEADAVQRESLLEQIGDSDPELRRRIINSLDEAERESAFRIYANQVMATGMSEAARDTSLPNFLPPVGSDLVTQAVDNVALLALMRGLGPGVMAAQVGTQERRQAIVDGMTPEEADSLGAKQALAEYVPMLVFGRLARTMGLGVGTERVAQSGGAIQKAAQRNAIEALGQLSTPTGQKALMRGIRDAMTKEIKLAPIMKATGRGAGELAVEYTEEMTTAVIQEYNSRMARDPSMTMTSDEIYEMAKTVAAQVGVTMGVAHGVSTVQEAVATTQERRRLAEERQIARNQVGMAATAEFTDQLRSLWQERLDRDLSDEELEEIIGNAAEVRAGMVAMAQERGTIEPELDATAKRQRDQSIMTKIALEATQEQASQLGERQPPELLEAEAEAESLRQQLDEAPRIPADATPEQERQIVEERRQRLETRLGEVEAQIDEAQRVQAAADKTRHTVAPKPSKTAPATPDQEGAPPQPTAIRQGRRVRFVAGNNELTGEFVGRSPDGRLRVKTAGGKVRVISEEAAEILPDVGEQVIFTDRRGTEVRGELLEQLPDGRQRIKMENGQVARVDAALVRLPQEQTAEPITIEEESGDGVPVIRADAGAQDQIGEAGPVPPVEGQPAETGPESEAEKGEPLREGATAVAPAPPVVPESASKSGSKNETNGADTDVRPNVLTLSEQSGALVDNIARNLMGTTAKAYLNPDGGYDVILRQGVGVRVRPPTADERAVVRDALNRQRRAAGRRPLTDIDSVPFRGFYDRDTNTIVINPDNSTDFTVDHEFIHFFRSTGRIRNGEFNALVRLAERTIRNGRSIPDIVDALQPGLDPDQRDEEIVAHLVEFAAEGTIRLPKKTVLSRVSDILRDLGALLGITAPSASKALSRARSGQFFERQGRDVPRRTQFEDRQEDLTAAVDEARQNVRPFSVSADDVERFIASQPPSIQPELRQTAEQERRTQTGDRQGDEAAVLGNVRMVASLLTPTEPRRAFSTTDEPTLEPGTPPSEDPRVRALFDRNEAIEVGPGDSISRLATNYIEDRIPQFNPTGKKVSTSYDAAMLFATLRSPYVERLSWALTNESGTVVAGGIHSIGSMTGTEGFGTPSSMFDVRRAIQAHRDSQLTLWVSHNHPSGDPEPSKADHATYARTRKAVALHGVAFRGLVVDTDHYAEVGESNEYELHPYQVESPWYVAGSGPQIRTPDDAAEYMSQIRHGEAPIVGLWLDTRQKVRGITAHPAMPTADEFGMLSTTMAAESLIVVTNQPLVDGDPERLPTIAQDFLIVTPKGQLVSLRRNHPELWGHRQRDRPEISEGQEKYRPMNLPGRSFSLTEETEQQAEAAARLANPGSTERRREVIAQTDAILDQESKREGIDMAELRTLAEDEVRRRPKTARREIIAKTRRGDVLDPLETMVAQVLLDRDVGAMLKNRSKSTTKAVVEMQMAYRSSGTKQAQAMRARQDRLQKPEARFRSFLAMFTNPPKDIILSLSSLEDEFDSAVRRGDKRAADAALSKMDNIRSKWADRASAMMDAMAQQGIDVNDVTLPQKLTDDVTFTRAVKATEPMRHSGMERFWDIAEEYWINSILSGPQTHVVNATSNALSLGWEFTIQRGAESLVNMIPGIHREDQATFRELTHVYRAMLKALPSAFTNAVRSFRAEADLYEMGLTGQDVTKFEESPKFAISGAAAGIGGRTGKTIDVIGRVIRAPGAALIMGDGFFKTIVTNGQVAALAYRQAKADGLTDGADIEAYVQSQLLNTGSEMYQQALSKAKELLFQESVGVIGQGIQKARGLRVPGIQMRPLVFIVPFIRTPWNVFKIGLRKTPLGTASLALNVMQNVIQHRNVSGITDDEVGVFRRQVGEQLLAWGMLSVLARFLGGDDPDDIPRITGARVPSASPGERAIQYRTAPPMSIRIGETWYDYGRLEPLSTALAGIVDGLNEARSTKETPAKVAGLLTRLTKQTQDKTFLSGISDIMDAMQDPERFASRYVQNFAASWVPNIARQPARNLQENLPEFRNLPSYEGESTASIWQRRLTQGAIPIDSLQPPAKVDLWGREIKRNAAWSTDGVTKLVPLFTPVKVRDVVDDPATQLDQIILRYNWWNPDQPRWPNKPRGWDGITEKQYHQYLKRSGTLAANALSRPDMLAQIDIEKPTAETMDVIDRIVRKARAQAKKEIKGK